MLNLSEDVYCALGRVVVGAAYFDDLLAGVVIRLLDSDNAGIVIAGQSYSYLDQAARALGKKTLSVDLNDELVSLLDDVKPLHIKRDLVVHGIWLPHPDEVHKIWDDEPSISQHLTLRKRRWKTDLHGEFISLNEIMNLAAELEIMADRVKELLTRTW